MKTSGLVVTAIALAGCFFLGSCKKEPPVEPQEFTYELAIPNAMDKKGLVLKELGAPVKKIEGVPDWLFAQAVTGADGIPVLWVSFDRYEEFARREGVITLTAENGNKAIVTVFQLGEADGGDGDDISNNANGSWLTDWETFDMVALNGFENEQYTPWHPNAATPADHNMFRDMTKRNGWEMAFSSLNDLHADGRRYFGLYNRWLGILRVFCYVKNPGTGAPELAFDVDMGYSDGNRYPFYNALEYAIPTNHSTKNQNLNLYVDLTGYGVQTTFKDIKTPYNKTVSSAMTVGWNVFDIDMTGYVPDDSPWLADKVDDRISVNAIGRKMESITLAGSISANITGTQTDQSVIQHGGASAQSGVVSVLDFISSITGSAKSAANYARDRMSSRDFMGKDFLDWKDRAYMYYAPYLSYISTGAKIASGVIDWMTSHETDIDEETIPGKIDLTMDGTINLSGAITGFQSTGDVGGITVQKDEISRVNRDSDGNEGHMGSGIISLAEDPVIYVASEDLLANVDHFNVNVKEKGVYTNADIETDHVRLVAFLDPTTIKLNLNTGLYLHKIKDVRVSATYGVFLDAPYGSTDNFRNVLCLNRPTVDLSVGKTKGINRFTGNSQIRIHQVKDYEFFDRVPLDDPETAENTGVQKHTKGESPVSYYGRVTEVVGKKFIKSPQVYVPVAKQGSTAYLTDGVVPDFVVCVYVLFELDGMPYTFTLHYLPRIELVGHSALCAIKDRLEKYADDCVNARVITTLANDPTVDVLFPYGGPETDKTLNLLRQICN